MRQLAGPVINGPLKGSVIAHWEPELSITFKDNGVVLYHYALDVGGWLLVHDGRVLKGPLEANIVQDTYKALGL